MKYKPINPQSLENFHVVEKWNMGYIRLFVETFLLFVWTDIALK